MRGRRVGRPPPPGVTSTSITVGSHQPLTGPAAPGYSEIAPATKAMFDYVNAKGGVNGRKINYTYEDDGYNPSKTATVVRKLVLQDNVFAILNGLGTPTHQQVEPFLNTEKVPDVFVASGCTLLEPARQVPLHLRLPAQLHHRGPHPRQLHPHELRRPEGRLSAPERRLRPGRAGRARQGDPRRRRGVEAELRRQHPVGAARPTRWPRSRRRAPRSWCSSASRRPTALALLAAALIGYHPQFVASSVDVDIADPGRPAAELLQGQGRHGPARWHDHRRPTCRPRRDTANSWIQLFKKIHDQYDTAQSLRRQHRLRHVGRLQLRPGAAEGRQEPDPQEPDGRR